MAAAAKAAAAGAAAAQALGVPNEGSRILTKEWNVGMRRERILLRHVFGANWIVGTMEETVQRLKSEHTVMLQRRTRLDQQ